MAKLNGTVSISPDQWKLPDWMTIGDNATAQQNTALMSTPPPTIPSFMDTSSTISPLNNGGFGVGPLASTNISSAFLGGGAYPGGSYINPAVPNGPNGPLTGSLAGGAVNPDTGAGGWFDMKGKGGMALGAAQLGLGAFNAWMGYKNQKFMQDYYGDQMDLQKADFGNNAKMTNLKLEDRYNTQLSNRGVDPFSATGSSNRADYMKQWAVKEKI